MKISDEDFEKAKAAWKRRCPGVRGWTRPLRAAIEALPDRASESAPGAAGWPESLLDGTRGRAEVFREALLVEREHCDAWRDATGCKTPDDARARIAQVNAANALPVPGAAVRALVERYKGNHSRETLFRVAEEIEAALAADGVASQELPTREEIAQALLNAYRGPYRDLTEMCQLGGGAQEGWGAAADHVRSLLARRPATDEAEALPRPDRKEIAHALILTFQKASKELRAPDYEAPWFAVADEAIKLCAPGDGPCPVYTAQLQEEVTRLRAELEKTRGELEACKRDAMASESNQAWGESILKGHYDELLAQHEALKTSARRVLSRYGMADAQAMEDCAQLRALLKPAPAEAEPVQHPPPESAAGFNHLAAAGLPEPRPFVPPESAMVDPLRAELDALWVFVRGVSALRGPLRQGCSVERFADEADRALDARKERS